MLHTAGTLMTIQTLIRVFHEKTTYTTVFINLCVQNNKKLHDTKNVYLHLKSNLVLYILN